VGRLRRDSDLFRWVWVHGTVQYRYSYGTEMRVGGY